MVLLESQIKLKKGDIAPDFELLGIDDKTHTLKDYENYKGILVIFMCVTTVHMSKQKWMH